MISGVVPVAAVATILALIIALGEVTGGSSGTVIGLCITEGQDLMEIVKCASEGEHSPHDQ